MKKLIKVLQYIWLGIGITALVMGAYYTSTSGIKEGTYFFIITFASGVMYAVNKRRFRLYVESEAIKESK